MALKQKYVGKIEFLTVDTSKEENLPLIEQYEVNAIPAFYFLGQNGAKIDSTVGEMTESQLEARLKNLLENYK